MIRKSTLGAIAFMTAIGVASPALAQYGWQYDPSAAGGGSAGYNHGLKYYRLKRHHVKPHASVKQQEKRSSQ
jgi:hypothetical protein